MTERHEVDDTELQRQAYVRTQRERGKVRDPFAIALAAGFAASLVAMLALNLAGLDGGEHPAVPGMAVLVGGITYLLFREEKKNWWRAYEANYEYLRAASVSNARWKSRGSMSG